MFVDILDFVASIYTVTLRRLHRIFRGLVSSVIVWLGIIVIHASSLPMESKNMYTFICSAPLMGLAMLLAKPLRIDFQCKDNPLTNLGIFFSINQVLYLIPRESIFSNIDLGKGFTILNQFRMFFSHNSSKLILQQKKVTVIFEFQH